MKSEEFLLEIGVEEIPHWMIPGALRDLERGFLAALEDANLCQGVEAATEATPRRLVLVANGVADRQADREETLKGPPRRVAFDAEGKPTKAAQGFAKRAGVGVENLEAGGDGRLLAKRLVKGRSTSEILAEVLPAVILGIHFPKAMYWRGKSGARFIRPIRSLLALLNGEVVPFAIEGVRSGSSTFGHRRLGAGKIEVSGWEDYKQKLEENFVILSAGERRKRIERGYEEFYPPTTSNVRVRYNPALLEDLVYLTEYPTVIRGDFDPRFLSLPDEVLETVMLHHQKYFAVEDVNSGFLWPHFVAVANLDGDPDGVIRQGHERVLRARFSDAEFFWQADQKRKLSERVEDLKHVTYHAKLGSYYDKTRRNQSLVAALAEATGGLSPQQYDDALRATELAKCDLTTEMVGEFPELQGVIGGKYADVQGESREVYEAIRDHHMPRGSNDSVPRGGRIGQIVAVADKLDTLGGMFRLGMLPSGSKDPFALRRAAYGIIRIICGALRLKISTLCGMAGAGENTAELREFFVDRLRYYLREQGFQYDEINAVLTASDDDPRDIVARCRAIAKVRSTENFEPLAVSFKRIKNILQQAGGIGQFEDGRVDQSLLESGPEAELFQTFEKLRPRVAEHKGQGDYASALSAIASLRPPVDLFFDEVLVMAKEEGVRQNRLTFLAQLLREFSTIADFAEIVSA